MKTGDAFSKAVGFCFMNQASVIMMTLASGDVVVYGCSVCSLFLFPLVMGPLFLCLATLFVPCAISTFTTKILQSCPIKPTASHYSSEGLPHKVVELHCQELQSPPQHGIVLVSHPICSQLP